MCEHVWASRLHRKCSSVSYSFLSLLANLSGCVFSFTADLWCNALGWLLRSGKCQTIIIFYSTWRGCKEDDCGPHSLVRGFRRRECWVADKAFRGDGEFQLWVWGSKADAQPVTWLWWRSRPRLLVSSLSKPPDLQETTQVAAISCLPVHTVTPCQQNSFPCRKDSGITFQVTEDQWGMELHADVL